MSLTTAAKNTMLNALTVNLASLHTAFPGLTGASEVTGGGYAQQAITFGAAAGSIRTSTGAVAFSVPISTIRWVGFWNGATFIGYAPNGGTPQEFVAVPSTDTIYCPAHGLSDTNKITFFNGTAPAGLTLGTVYFVRDSTTDTFKVAATAGGIAIDLTTAGTSDCQLSYIVEEAYAAPGTHTITVATLGLPF